MKYKCLPLHLVLLCIALSACQHVEPAVKKLPIPPPLATYHSDTYGIEFSYPNSWQTDVESTNRQLRGMDLVFHVGPSDVSDGVRFDFVKKKDVVKTTIAHFDKKSVLSVTDIPVGGEQGKLVRMRDFGITLIFVQHGNILFQFVTDGKLLKEGVIGSVRFFEPIVPPKK
jgi:hypothetical protein